MMDSLNELVLDMIQWWADHPNATLKDIGCNTVEFNTSHGTLEIIKPLISQPSKEQGNDEEGNPRVE